MLFEAKALYFEKKHTRLLTCTHACVPTFRSNAYSNSCEQSMQVGTLYMNDFERIKAFTKSMHTQKCLHVSTHTHTESYNCMAIRV